MDRTYGFYPFGLRNPFIRELRVNEPGTLVFDGYFYVDANDLPVQRVMVRFGEEMIDEQGNTYRAASSDMHIEIYEKISGEDTSFFGDEKIEDISGNTNDDDSEENICFFPTEITTLKYRILKTDLTKVEREMVLASIKEQEKLRETNRIKNIMAHLGDDE